MVCHSVFRELGVCVYRERSLESNEQTNYMYCSMDVSVFKARSVAPHRDITRSPYLFPPGVRSYFNTNRESECPKLRDWL